MSLRRQVGKEMDPDLHGHCANIRTWTGPEAGSQSFENNRVITQLYLRALFMLFLSHFPLVVILFPYMFNIRYFRFRGRV